MTAATATGAEALNPDRVICSTITLRHLPFDEALDAIAGLGFTEIDLGALPGVCNHVPYELTADAVREVAEVVNRSGLSVRSVNADVGDLNRPLDAFIAEGEIPDLDMALRCFGQDFVHFSLHGITNCPAPLISRLDPRPSTPIAIMPSAMSAYWTRE